MSIKSLKKSLLSDVRVVPDFPKPGVNFVDVSSITTNRPLFSRVIEALAADFIGPAMALEYSFVGIESRGFIFAAPLACLCGKPLVLARKRGKLPADTYSQEYALEYGSAVLEMNKSDIVPGHHYVLVDDIVATGGTIAAVEKLITDHGGIVDKALAVYAIKACQEIADKVVKTDVKVLASI